MSCVNIVFPDDDWLACKIIINVFDNMQHKDAASNTMHWLIMG